MAHPERSIPYSTVNDAINRLPGTARTLATAAVELQQQPIPLDTSGGRGVRPVSSFNALFDATVESVRIANAPKNVRDVMESKLGEVAVENPLGAGVLLVVLQTARAYDN